jgi:hypothetical protein
MEACRHHLSPQDVSYTASCGKEDSSVIPSVVEGPAVKRVDRRDAHPASWLLCTERTVNLDLQETSTCSGCGPSTTMAVLVAALDRSLCCLAKRIILPTGLEPSSWQCPPPADKKARVDCRNIDIEKSLYGAGIVKFVDNHNVQVPNYLENKVTLPCAIQEAVIERWMKASKSYKYKFASSRKPKAAAGVKRKKPPKMADDKEGRKSHVLHFTEDNAMQAAMGKNDERILDSADEDKIGGTKVDL